ncbi:hypothetical protein GUJ93_ZPchr0007g3734 [Zizania palustris]|uniref:Uncharacterized protein n=1 Tax=Zizania palustris TaxID=103762 RepID=A0A8J5T435_ZIZPA|nr:hypothetical protein GUJ93_ZPchr0007g3734 [Zizania palustris]
MPDRLDEGKWDAHVQGRHYLTSSRNILLLREVMSYLSYDQTQEKSDYSVHVTKQHTVKSQGGRRRPVHAPRCVCPPTAKPYTALCQVSPTMPGCLPSDAFSASGEKAGRSCEKRLQLKGRAKRQRQRASSVALVGFTCGACE